MGALLVNLIILNKSSLTILNKERLDFVSTAFKYNVAVVDANDNGKLYKKSKPQPQRYLLS